MKLPLNFELLKQPLNWVIVTLMVVIGMMAVTMLKTYVVKKSNQEG